MEVRFTLHRGEVGILPARVLGLWELDMTSEVAEIFIRWTMSIVKLVNGEKVPKNIRGLCQLHSKFTTHDSQFKKGQNAEKLKITLTHQFLMSLIQDLALLQRFTKKPFVY